MQPDRYWTVRRAILALVLIAAAITITVAIATPNLLRSKSAADQARFYAGKHAAIQFVEPSDLPSIPPVDTRKIVRTATMTLLVSDVAHTSAQIESLVSSSGGYVKSSSIQRGDSGVRQATFTLSIPADRLDAVRTSLRDLASRVDSDEVQAQEVTAEYVDLQSSLRNFRAEEAQYLSIMRRSGTIHDTLEVARNLADVRGRIERTQGRINLLDHQVAMASLEITLRTDAIPLSPSERWQPVRHARAALRDALQNLAGYADFLVTVLIELPVVFLWLCTAIAAIAFVLRLMRWTWRKFFATIPATAQA